MVTLSWVCDTNLAKEADSPPSFLCILLNALQLLSFALWKPLEILFPHIFRLPLVDSGGGVTESSLHLFFYFKVNELPPTCEWSLTVKSLCKDDCRGSIHTLTIHTGNPKKNAGHLCPCAPFMKGLSCKGTPTTLAQVVL